VIVKFLNPFGDAILQALAGLRAYPVPGSGISQGLQFLNTVMDYKQAPVVWVLDRGART
jgi:hypothetical protein